MSGVNDFAVNGGELVLVASSPGEELRGALLGTMWRDQDVHVKVQTDKAPSGASQIAYLMLRAQDLDFNYYRVPVAFTSGLAITIGLEKVLAGAVTVLASPVTPGRDAYTSGTEFWIRAQATGSHPTLITARVWKNGTAEPTGWDVTGGDG